MKDGSPAKSAQNIKDDTVVANKSSDGTKIAQEFMKKLRGKKFTMSVPPLGSSALTDAEESKAVKEFLGTELFDYIMDGCREKR